MNNGCNFTNCCICLYGNECMPFWELPNEYTLAPRTQIIQRLIDAQFSSYRYQMIRTLKDVYDYDYNESNFSEAILKKYDFISEDIDLDNCPFCGGPAELYITKHIPKGYDFTPRCKHTACCGRLTKKYTSKKTAIKCWNMRVPLNQLKSDIKQKICDIKSEIGSMKNLPDAGIPMIDTDPIFFSSYDSAVKYANQDPSIPFSKFSLVGQILDVREDSGHIGKYFIASDRSLQKLEGAIGREPNIYTKQEIDNEIT